MDKSAQAVLICPAFFDYKVLIEKQLSNRFKLVHSFSDRPKCSSVGKALIKYNVVHYNRFVSSRYSKDLLKKITPYINDITTVIIVKGTCISPLLIKGIKTLNPKVRVIAYCWDSIANSNGFVQLASVADKAMSFDFADCQQYQLEYVPLFFPDDNTFITATSKSTYSYQYSFIGSYHSDRAKLLYKLVNNEQAHSASSFIKIYFQSKIQYCVFYLIDPYVRKCPKEWITFEIVDRNSMNDIFYDSRFIIDIHHKGQSGLTMRTWETLSLDYNLLTTNPYVLLHQAITVIDILDRTNGTLWSNDQKQQFVKQVGISNISTTPLSLSHWLDALLK